MPRPKPLKYSAEMLRAFNALMAEVNATAETDRAMYEWTLDTKHGKLSLSLGKPPIRCNVVIYGRFDDPDRAKGAGLDVNPFSGKWNHYYPTEWTPKEIAADLGIKLGMLGGPQLATA